MGESAKSKSWARGYQEIRSYLSKAKYKNEAFDKFVDMLDYHLIKPPVVFEEDDKNELTATWKQGENYAEFSVDETSLVTYIIKEDGKTDGRDDISVDNAIFMLRQSFVYQIK